MAPSWKPAPTPTISPAPERELKNHPRPDEPYTFQTNGELAGLNARELHEQQDQPVGVGEVGGGEGDRPATLSA